MRIAIVMPFLDEAEALPATLARVARAVAAHGDAEVIAKIYRTRVVTRGKGDEIWGWAMAYGGSGKLAYQPGGKA